MIHDRINSLEAGPIAKESSLMSILQMSDLRFGERVEANVPFQLPSDSMQLFDNAEMRAAIGAASSITVTDDCSNADVVLKPDGAIQQFLRMDRKGGDLVIALEKGDFVPDISADKQFQLFKSLMEYAQELGKVVEMDFASGPVRTASDTGDCSSARTVYDTGRQVARTTTDTSYRPERNISDAGGYQPARTISDTSAYQPPQVDWSQIDLFDLLMDWFASDPEAFKERMPGLYKKIVGADGRIDTKKLRHLVDSKDPSLESLRSHSSGKVSTSCDAVNATGAKLADKAAQVSDELGTYGYCAKGVSYAIERATGKIIYGNANDMRETLPSEGFTVSKSKDLKVGQVVHVYWTPEVYAQEQARRGPCPNYGDIAVIGKGRDGQLYAYNDAATPLDDYLKKSRYDWSTLKVFTPPNS